MSWIVSDSKLQLQRRGNWNWSCPLSLGRATIEPLKATHCLGSLRTFCHKPVAAGDLGLATYFMARRRLARSSEVEAFNRFMERFALIFNHPGLRQGRVLTSSVPEKKSRQDSSSTLRSTLRLTLTTLLSQGLYHSLRPFSMSPILFCTTP
ncbi:hypothetical protein J6590_008178 [Homalodisca vitripennis]|nr:hypothetical protein J6590_008178 [Homalodisca vitripennis]